MMGLRLQSKHMCKLQGPSYFLLQLENKKLKISTFAFIIDILKTNKNILIVNKQVYMIIV